MSQYVRNMGAMIGQSTIQRLLGMFTTIVLARVLGSANFGIYSIVVNTANSAYGLVRMGIDAAIHVHTAELHSDAETREAKGQMLGAGLILLMGAGIMGAVICLVFAQWIADVIYGQPELAHWIRLAAILVFFQCSSQFCYASLAGLHRFNEYARVMILAAFLNILSTSMASWFWNLHGALFAFIFVQVITSCLLWYYAIKVLKLESISLKFLQVKKSFRSLIRTGFPFYLSGLIAMPVFYYLQGTLGRIVGLDSLGQFRVIVSITTMISFLPVSIAAVMVSNLAREYGSDYTNFVRQTLLSIKFTWIFVLLTSAAVFTILPILISVLFGKSYGDAIAPATAALISSIFSCILGVVGNVALSRKRLYVILAYTSLQAIILLGLGLMLIPYVGLTGYFLAESFSMGSALLFVWYLSRTWRQRNGVSPCWILPMVTLSMLFVIIFCLSAWLEQSEHNLWVGLTLLISSIFFIYFFTLDTTERNQVKRRMFFLIKIK
jgi:O-antigen/teichoic acid export membrane protein